MKPKIMKWQYQLVNPFMQRGFRNRETVETWAQKHEYGTVYYDERRQAVYVDRALKAQADARHLEKESEHLLEHAEAL